MAGATRILELSLQPGQAMLQEGDRPGLGVTTGLVGSTVFSGQLHEGGGDLLGTAAGFLPLLGMPVALLNGQQSVQGFGKLAAAFRPGLQCWGRGCRPGKAGFGEKRHWTQGGMAIHPGAMPNGLRRSHRRRPSGWLHSLSSLLAVAARGERLKPDDVSSGARRLRQHLELGQRLLDPLPKPLRTGQGQAEWFWRALRWGGGGLVLAWLLRR